MISAVITAAGNSRRFGRNKLLGKIAGKPLLMRTVEQFLKAKGIEEIIVVGQKKDLTKYQKILAKEGLEAKFIEGGSERIISCLNGIKASKGEIVITHDGARPLVPVKLIEGVICAAEKYGAAITAIAPTATIKYAPKNSVVKKSLPRAVTWFAQTPQGFKREIILPALERAVRKKEFTPTDDSEFVTKMGLPVKIIPGDPVNIKVTHPPDLILANQLFKFVNHRR